MLARRDRGRNGLLRLLRGETSLSAGRARVSGTMEQQQWSGAFEVRLDVQAEQSNANSPAQHGTKPLYGRGEEQHGRGMQWQGIQRASMHKSKIFAERHAVASWEAPRLPQRSQVARYTSFPCRISALEIDVPRYQEGRPHCCVWDGEYIAVDNEINMIQQTVHVNGIDTFAASRPRAIRTRDTKAGCKADLKVKWVPLLFRPLCLPFLSAPGAR
eukprot:364426-Chlamydomonas_euryale.AAC.37